MADFTVNVTVVDHGTDPPTFSFDPAPGDVEVGGVGQGSKTIAFTHDPNSSVFTFIGIKITEDPADLASAPGVSAGDYPETPFEAVTLALDLKTLTVTDTGSVDKIWCYSLGVHYNGSNYWTNMNKIDNLTADYAVRVTVDNSVQPPDLIFGKDSGDVDVKGLAQGWKKLAFIQDPHSPSFTFIGIKIDANEMNAVSATQVSSGDYPNTPFKSIALASGLKTLTMTDAGTVDEIWYYRLGICYNGAEYWPDPKITNETGGPGAIRPPRQAFYLTNRRHRPRHRRRSVSDQGRPKVGSRTAGSGAKKP